MTENIKQKAKELVDEIRSGKAMWLILDEIPLLTDVAEFEREQLFDEVVCLMDRE